MLPGVAEALARLKAAGFALVVVTNQPDVARGRQTAEVVNAMHARLAALLPIDEFRVCYHDDADACECRKPKPGLLTQAARSTTSSRSVMVGDRWRDIEAGRRAGCRAAILVDYGYDEGHAGDAGRAGPLARGSGRLDPLDHGERMNLTNLRTKIFADGADLDGMLALYRQPLHQGLHDQPDADAQGRHHRLPRASPSRCSRPFPIGRSRSRCSPTSSTRWSARRARSPPGASTST